MSATTLTPTRALRQPRHVDWRAVFGVCLVLLATAASIAFWTTTSDTRSVVIATRDLPAGATLGPADLAISRVRVDDDVYQAAVPASDLNRVIGTQLGAPLYSHQVLARAQLSTGPRIGQNQRALTIAVTPDTALGDALHPGDAVAVLVTTNQGKPDAHTAVVLPRATVYEVGYADRVGAINVDPANMTTARGAVRWVTLIIDKDQIVALTQAKWSGEVDLALLPPS